MGRRRRHARGRGFLAAAGKHEGRIVGKILPDARLRKCLRFGGQFWSEGRLSRMCESCHAEGE